MMAPSGRTPLPHQLGVVIDDRGYGRFGARQGLAHFEYIPRVSTLESEVARDSSSPEQLWDCNLAGNLKVDASDGDVLKKVGTHVQPNLCPGGLRNLPINSRKLIPPIHQEHCYTCCEASAG